ncbi:hypothetical protein LTR09_012952 [Extremus antarcticus]|uniref:Uncharacterized protein n=1 Tax=Extremus antarcticus TaxID=702011 RepID=A0AAJ0D4C9_9PEZI|nr:hypothetical protein LTR09_012952 [Extremus antarcticus]
MLLVAGHFGVDGFDSWECAGVVERAKVGEGFEAMIGVGIYADWGSIVTTVDAMAGAFDIVGTIAFLEVLVRDEVVEDCVVFPSFLKAM